MEKFEKSLSFIKVSFSELQIHEPLKSQFFYISNFTSFQYFIKFVTPKFGNIYCLEVQTFLYLNPFAEFWDVAKNLSLQKQGFVWESEGSLDQERSEKRTKISSDTIPK